MIEHYEPIDMTGTTLLASQPNPIPERKRMNATNILDRTFHLMAVTLLASLVSLPVFGKESSTREPSPVGVETVDVIQTRFVPRVITNIIEVRVPTNKFINVYRTNQFEAVRSNVFDVYRTNWVSRTRTNTIAVELGQTNLVTRYQTNLVTRYRTNLNTLTLTNWESVLVFKTNFITRPIINLVQIDVPAGQAGTAKSAETVESKVATATAAPAAASLEGLVLKATKTGKSPVNDQVEVSLKLKSADDETPTFLSQEWQVERTDGSVLLYGRGEEFKRELPPGAYKVEAKVRATENGALVRVRGNFEVTRDEVIQQKPATVVKAS